MVTNNVAIQNFAHEAKFEAMQNNTQESQGFCFFCDSLLFPMCSHRVPKETFGSIGPNSFPCFGSRQFQVSPKF
jgi:hypothetical protein